MIKVKSERIGMKRSLRSLLLLGLINGIASAQTLNCSSPGVGCTDYGQSYALQIIERAKLIEAESKQRTAALQADMNRAASGPSMNGVYKPQLPTCLPNQIPSSFCQ